MWKFSGLSGTGVIMISKDGVHLADWRVMHNSVRYQSEHPEVKRLVDAEIAAYVRSRDEQAKSDAEQKEARIREALGIV